MGLMGMLMPDDELASGGGEGASNCSTKHKQGIGVDATAKVKSD